MQMPSKSLNKLKAYVNPGKPQGFKEIPSEFFGRKSNSEFSKSIIRAEI
jgi:hypothetical protein